MAPVQGLNFPGGHPPVAREVRLHPSHEPAKYPLHLRGRVAPQANGVDSLASGNAPLQGLQLPRGVQALPSLGGEVLGAHRAPELLDFHGGLALEPLGGRDLAVAETAIGLLDACRRQLLLLLRTVLGPREPIVLRHLVGHTPSAPSLLVASVAELVEVSLLLHLIPTPVAILGVHPATHLLAGYLLVVPPQFVTQQRLSSGVPLRLRVRLCDWGGGVVLRATLTALWTGIVGLSDEERVAYYREVEKLCELRVGEEPEVRLQLIQVRNSLPQVHLLRVTRHTSPPLDGLNAVESGVAKRPHDLGELLLEFFPLPPGCGALGELLQEVEETLPHFDLLLHCYRCGTAGQKIFYLTVDCVKVVDGDLSECILCELVTLLVAHTKLVPQPVKPLFRLHEKRLKPLVPSRLCLSNPPALLPPRLASYPLWPTKVLCSHRVRGGHCERLRGRRRCGAHRLRGHSLYWPRVGGGGGGKLGG
eukprot:Hpha_TRINITY_DN15607_c0_g6::TRINITY_DN15607_c0_g6_i1::g.99528::m.99528